MADEILEELSILCDDAGIDNRMLDLWVAGKMIGGRPVDLSQSPTLCKELLSYRLRVDIVNNNAVLQWLKKEKA